MHVYSCPPFRTPSCTTRLCQPLLNGKLVAGKLENPLDAQVVLSLHPMMLDDLTYVLRMQAKTYSVSDKPLKQAWHAFTFVTALSCQQPSVCELSPWQLGKRQGIGVRWITRSVYQTKKDESSSNSKPCDRDSWQETGAYLVTQRAVVRCKGKVTSQKARARGLGCARWFYALV